MSVLTFPRARLSDLNAAVLREETAGALRLARNLIGGYIASGDRSPPTKRAYDRVSAVLDKIEEMQ
jgi:hypothetical protein